MVKIRRAEAVERLKSNYESDYVKMSPLLYFADCEELAKAYIDEMADRDAMAAELAALRARAGAMQAALEALADVRCLKCGEKAVEEFEGELICLAEGCDCNVSAAIKAITRNVPSEGGA